MYELERGINLEDLPRRQPGRRSPFPLERMKPGDSFLVKHHQDCDKASTRAPVQMAVTRMHKLHPERHYTVRYSPRENGFRVFRLEDRE